VNGSFVCEDQKIREPHHVFGEYKLMIKFVVCVEINSGCDE